MTRFLGGALLPTVLIAVLLSSWSLLRPGFFRVHDYVHGARIAEMQRAVADGQIPPRWSAHFGYGYGMPLFSFYGPFPYYIGALSYWLSDNLLFSTASLWWLSSLGTAIAGYLLGRRLGGWQGGVLASLTLTLAPYRAVNLFVRGAVAESWGMMAGAWLLFHLVSLLGILIQVSKEKVLSQNQLRQSWLHALLLALWTAILITSHTLSALMMLPILGLAVACWLGWRLLTGEDSFLRSLRLAWPVLASVLLGTALSAYFSLPAFFEKEFTQIDRILGGYFHYSQHFLYLRQFVQVNWGYGGSVFGPMDDISFFLGWATWGVLFFGLIGSVASFFRLYKKNGLTAVLTYKALRLTLIALAAAALTAFLGLSHAKALWDTLSLLAFVQFPWRYLTVFLLAITVLAGLLPVLLSPWPKARYSLLALVLASTVLQSMFFKPESYLENPDALYYADPERIRREMSSILPDFIPAELAESRMSAASSGALATPSDMTLIDSGAAEQRINRSQAELWQFSLNEPQLITFSRATFPGWRAEIDGAPTPLRTSDEGLLQVMVPEGEHKVGLIFGRTPLRFWSELLSLAALFFWANAIVISQKLCTRPADTP